MSRWRATGASSARHAIRPLGRIGVLLAGVCLSGPALLAQTPTFTVPRIIPPVGTMVQAASPEPPPEVTPLWQAPLVAGKFDEALARAADAPWARAYIEGRASERVGRYDDAERAYRQALADQPTGEPAVALAELLTRLGRADEASVLWQAIVRAGQAQRTGGAMSRAARAAQALGQVRLSNSYFQTAANLSPDDPQVHTRWGDLFLEKYNQAEARSSYETALKADAQYVPAMIGLARSLAGFTFYRNTTGIAPTTALSLPMIHARRKASAGALLADLYASAVQQGSVLRALARQGWSVSLVNPIFKCPEDIETCAGQTAILRGRWGSTAQEASWLLDLALFRSAPLALKQKIYRGGSWFTRSLAVEPDALAGNHLLDEIGRRLEPVDRPTLHFLHLMGSHPPALVRADCVPEAREWTRATAVDQAECVLRGVTTFLDRLRAAGLYGTASIFVVADHGAGFSHRRASGAPDGDAAASLAGSANPLLLLKGPGDSGPLRLSDAPAELGDVPGSLCALDPGCGGAFGDGVEKVPASLQRERPFLAYQWNGNYWEADRGMQFQEFTIRGPVWDTASWKRVGSGSEVARSRLDFQQDDGEQAYGLGWGLFETSAGSSIRWVHGRSATLYLDLPEGRPLELYMVAGTIPANPHQTLALSVNGRPVGSIPVVGWLETRRLAIPAGVARQGTDELQLGFSEVMPPRPGDSRPLSVVFDQLEVR